MVLFCTGAISSNDAASFGLRGAGTRAGFVSFQHNITDGSPCGSAGSAGIASSLQHRRRKRQAKVRIYAFIYIRMYFYIYVYISGTKYVMRAFSLLIHHTNDKTKREGRSDKRLYLFCFVTSVSSCKSQHGTPTAQRR